MKRCVLITGSTGGMGYIWSEKFAKEGYDLILVGKNYRKLQEQKKYLESLDVNVEIIKQDLKVQGAANNIYEKVEKANLSVDILVNNAGFNECGRFTNTNIENEISMIQVHITCLTELTKLFIPKMIERKYGKILNVGSTGSYIASPLDSVYSATKAYILSFSNAISCELKGTGVTVSTLCPGATRTEFASKANIEDTMLFKIFVMNAKDVVEKSYKNFIRGKRVIIPGAYNKLLIITSKLTPVPVLNFICMKMLLKN